MIVVGILQKDLGAIREALFQDRDEQVVFAFARWDPPSNLKVVGHEIIPKSGFSYQSSFHILLTHETQARIIKKGHDLSAALVEFHSHHLSGRAGFSESDMAGFEEFVPHVLWRLPSRPYAAVVFNKSSFDGLVWRTRDELPEQLGIATERGILRPTGRTIEKLNSIS